MPEHPKAIVDAETVNAALPAELASAAEPPVIAPTESVQPQVAWNSLAEDLIRFRLRDMVIATTVFSVALGLFRLLGIAGALLSFVSAWVFTVALTVRRLPVDPVERFHVMGQRRILKDFLWGICMPIVCLVFDPFVFKSSGDWFDFSEFGRFDNTLNAGAYVVYPLVAFQLVILLFWLACGWSLRYVGGFIAGILLLGAATAYLIGLMLLPISLIGTFAMGLGLMGFTPWFTGFAYVRRLRRAFQLGRRNQSSIWFWVSLVTGFLAAAVLPLIVTGLLFGWDKLSFLNNLADILPVPLRTLS